MSRRSGSNPSANVTAGSGRPGEVRPGSRGFWQDGHGGHRYGGRVIEDTLAFKLLKATKSTRPTIWPVLADLGLHPGQELLMSQLWKHDGISQTELVERLGVEPPTVSKALNRLERAGFVTRESAGRGRAQSVFLTGAGRALQEPVEAAWEQADEQLLEELGAEEREVLLTALARIVESVGRGESSPS